MLELQTAGPSTPLRPFVRAYAQRIVHGSEDVQSVCMPRVETILKFELGTPLEVLTPTNEPLASPGNVIVGAFGASSVRELLRPGLRRRSRRSAIRGRRRRRPIDPESGVSEFY